VPYAGGSDPEGVDHGYPAPVRRRRCEALIFGYLPQGMSPAQVRRSRVTEGFALGFGWLELIALLVWLGYFLLRRPR